MTQVMDSQVESCDHNAPKLTATRVNPIDAWKYSNSEKLPQERKIAHITHAFHLRINYEERSDYEMDKYVLTSSFLDRKIEPLQFVSGGQAYINVLSEIDLQKAEKHRFGRWIQ